MKSDFSKSISSLALWLCWLVLELELLLVANYPIRTELRALFGLPLYHVLLTFLTLMMLVVTLTPVRERFSGWTKFRPTWALVHLVLYGLLFSQLGGLWSASHQVNPILRVLLWTSLGLDLVASLTFHPTQAQRSLARVS